MYGIGGFQRPVSLHRLLLGFVCGFSSSFYYFSLPYLRVMYAFVRVEGKFIEVTGGVGGLFPFKIAESSRRKRSFIRLSF